MKREIKFRAWDKDERGWVKGNRVDIFMVALGFPKTVDMMQYTGLKDKNGVEIYEGDIVKHSGFYIGDGYYKNGIDAVVYDDGCYLGGNGELNSAEIFNKGIEVIGNIYENEDLIK